VALLLDEAEVVVAGVIEEGEAAEMIGAVAVLAAR